MPPVAVVTDTTCYLPADQVEAEGLREVSLYVHWQDRDDRESDLPDFDAYYEHLRTAPELPTRARAPRGQRGGRARAGQSERIDTR